MNAEIIAVGTELLMGQIANTNGQFLSQELANLGINVYFQTVVGDNAGRMRQALELARSRADLIVCTGGLGPTQDDLTKDVLADFLGRGMMYHEPSLRKMADFFAARGVVMVESNKRQAIMLDGSDPLANETGLAVGIALTQDGTHYMLLPGPPKEMKPMFLNYGVPWLRGVMTGEVPLVSKMLKFAGIGESALEHRLIDLIEAQTDPTIAPYAKEGEVAIRLTTRAASREDGLARIAPVETDIRGRLGEYIYADQDVTLEAKVLELLKTSGRTLAVAESCSGGLLSDMLTAVPGSSQAFLGGIVCYSNMLKHRLAGVPMEALEGPGAPGAVSEQTALLLAEGVLARTDADFAVSITGVAGPDPSEGKPVGLVYVGIAFRGEQPRAFELRTHGNRETIKLRAAKHALYRLWERLKPV
ncbi:damage-inducible protein CinA [Gordoniibacillus kamchatkensis]|uniref:Putative competence-damage inducible protein n=1 Tax=Gordoniibacillus kamchatkensis TaxID=1590651 RepID=A0ABR5AKB0_9BACL|nr:competence/damage-inducible protein A [Paenibacillus sp. VKM B-2647]KIL41406.1 damage-inducible protein CinA [Paenibacillus sp. VKM B-2647]